MPAQSSATTWPQKYTPFSVKERHLQPSLTYKIPTNPAVLPCSLWKCLWKSKIRIPMVFMLSSCDSRSISSSSNQLITGTPSLSYMLLSHYMIHSPISRFFHINTSFSKSFITACQSKVPAMPRAQPCMPGARLGGQHCPRTRLAMSPSKAEAAGCSAVQGTVQILHRSLRLPNAFKEQLIHVCIKY